ncbi:uncharacterized protein LOC115228461, partial [Octopus sinensis]|uniref:Uncharacterized protein LOC115228461 n=1 Tax=Octopus sinensis TaxID=2607531 RepID=A0A6P7TYB4_9MOLL
MDDDMHEYVMDISDSTHPSGSHIWVKAHCADVIMNAAFHNKHGRKAENDYGMHASATDGVHGVISLKKKPKSDHLTVTIIAKSRYALNASCYHSSYSISIMPKDSKHEVVCHRKDDERNCSYSETKSKCTKGPLLEAACIVKEVNSTCTAKQLDPACYYSEPVVTEVTQLINTSISKDGQIHRQVLKICNSTDYSGSTIWVTAHCAEVTMHGTFRNKIQTDAEYDYKTSAKDGIQGALSVTTKSKDDDLFLTLFAKKQQGLNSTACDNPSFSVRIMPKDSKHEVVCHRKHDERKCFYSETMSKCTKAPKVEAVCLVKHVHSPCTAKQLDHACYNTKSVFGEVTHMINSSIPMKSHIHKQVFEISNSTHSSGSMIWVKAHCAEVTMHVAFHNKHHHEEQHVYKTTAKHGHPDYVSVMKKTEEDHLTVTIIAMRQHRLNASVCDHHHPSYSVIIKPNDSKHEVVCHRKRDERKCSYSETMSKCTKAPKVEAVCRTKHMNSRCIDEHFHPMCYDKEPVVSDVSELLNSSVHKDGRTRKYVLEITNSTHSSGSKIWVKAHCAEVTMHVTFHKKHHHEDEKDYKTTAKDEYPGTVFVMEKPKNDHLTLVIFAKKQHKLNSKACDNPSFSVSIMPK